MIYVSGTSKESSDAPSLFAAFPSLSSCQTYVNHRIGRGYLLKVLARTFHILSSWVVLALTIIQSKTSNSFWVHKAQRFPATPVIATSSEPVIRMPQGNSSNCERTSIQGIPWVTTRQDPLAYQHDRTLGNDTTGRKVGTREGPVVLVPVVLVTLVRSC